MKSYLISPSWHHNTLRLRWYGCHFPDNIIKCIFLNENIHLLLSFLLKFVYKRQLNNILALVQVMVWWGPDKSHYLKQWCLVYWGIYAPLGLNELNSWTKWQCDWWQQMTTTINTLRPSQNSTHLPGHIFICNFMNEKVLYFYFTVGFFLNITS